MCIRDRSRSCSRTGSLVCSSASRTGRQVKFRRRTERVRAVSYTHLVCTVTVTDTTPSKDLTKEATSAIANCVTGYQAADKAATCQFGAEWVMLGRLRALNGAQGWKTKDADIQTYAASVMTAIQNGKLSRETVPRCV